MESTGVLWKPVWNLLEERFELLLVTRASLKQVPGPQKRCQDCQWIAPCCNAVLRSSFVRRVRNVSCGT